MVDAIFYGVALFPGEAFAAWFVDRGLRAVDLANVEGAFVHRSLDEPFFLYYRTAFNQKAQSECGGLSLPFKPMVV